MFIALNRFRVKKGWTNSKKYGWDAILGGSMTCEIREAPLEDRFYTFLEVFCLT